MKKLKHLHPVKRWKKLSDTKRLFVALSVFVIVVGGLIGWAQYQDWRNEQLLRNISADFAQLERDLEAELGIDVENKSGCFTTQEKFGDGKTGCFMRLETTSGEKTDANKLDFIVSSNTVFKDRSQFREQGFSATYGGWECTYGTWIFGDAVLYLECPVPVRAGNASLVDELF